MRQWHHKRASPLGPCTGLRRNGYTQTAWVNDFNVLCL